MVVQANGMAHSSQQRREEHCIIAHSTQAASRFTLHWRVHH